MVLWFFYSNLKLFVVLTKMFLHFSYSWRRHWQGSLPMPAAPTGPPSPCQWRQQCPSPCGAGVNGNPPHAGGINRALSLCQRHWQGSLPVPAASTGPPSPWRWADCNPAPIAIMLTAIHLCWQHCQGPKTHAGSIKGNPPPRGVILRVMKRWVILKGATTERRTAIFCWFFVLSLCFSMSSIKYFCKNRFLIKLHLL